jgi:hypothetical protein
MGFQLRIPPGLSFAHLKVARDPSTNALLCQPAPLAGLIRFNGGDAAAALADEDLAMFWIGHWYLAHVEAGGSADPVISTILREIHRDDEAVRKARVRCKPVQKLPRE